MQLSRSPSGLTDPAEPGGIPLQVRLGVSGFDQLQDASHREDVLPDGPELVLEVVDRFRSWFSGGQAIPTRRRPLHPQSGRADKGYAGAGIGIHSPTQERNLSPDNATHNALLTAIRAIGERGNSILKKWRALTRIRLNPERIGGIVQPPSCYQPSNGDATQKTSMLSDVFYDRFRRTDQRLSMKVDIFSRRNATAEISKIVPCATAKSIPPGRREQKKIALITKCSKSRDGHAAYSQRRFDEFRKRDQPESREWSERVRPAWHLAEVNRKLSPAER